MVDFKSIQDKWQKKWKENKVFEANVDKKKKKFFITTPYPYISGSLHIGHARAVTEVDVYSRFKRMEGYNVLYPMAFHISGTPVLGISLGIKNGDEKKIEQYKEYVRAYVTNKNEVENIVRSFEDPWKIVEFFIPKMINEYSSLGLGIDWRRSFTSGDVEHQKLVEWQFNKYKEKGYLMQGKYPVLFSKTLGNAVGEDDIIEGDTDPVEKKEFTLLKFPYEDAFLVIGTLRPDTVFGQTNLWVNPDVTYVKAKVNGEKWIISKPAADKLSYQDKKVEIIEEISGKSLIGKYCKALHKKGELLILPFKGCKPEIATGVVFSVPSSAPYDYLALKELQDSPQLCEKYGLDHAKIKVIQPIPIIESEGFSGESAKEICARMKITSVQQDKLIEEATKEIYRVEFYTGKLLKICEKYAGKSVQEAQKKIVEDLKKENKADIFYETSRAAKSRDGGEIVVAIMDNQWFLDFNAKGWKKEASQCLKSMDIVPDKYRKQFEDVFEWLDKRPCARLRGIGTQLPFDKKWVIESLSDSTIYMSLYSIQDKIKELGIKGEQLTPEFFDYVFLDKGKVEDLEKKLKIKNLKSIRESFDYWYPMDHRHTFPPHLANHLSFMIFAHTACFDKKDWPKKISFHGLIMSEGMKMSKSKGNVVTLMKLNNDFGADSFRAFLCNSTSIDGTMNWQSEEVVRMKNNVEHIFEVLLEMSKNRKSSEIKDKAFVSKIENLTKKATENISEMNLRNYSNVVLYDFMKEYQKAIRKGKDILAINDYLFERWVKMLTPLCPHYAEELWSGKGFVSIAEWPSYNEKNIDEKAEYLDETIDRLLSDIREIQKLTKLENIKKVKLVVANSWKYKFIKDFKKLIEKERNVGVLIKTLIDKEHSKEISNLIPALLKNPSKIPEIVLTQNEELAMLNESKVLIEKELKGVVEIEVAEKSSELKASNAMPSKPAVIIG